MASLKKRKATWYAVITIDGKQLVKTTGIKIDSDPQGQQARRIAERMEQEIRHPESVKKIPTIREYLQNYQTIGKESSANNHRTASTLFLRYLGHLANKSLDSLSAADCKDFFKQQIARVSFGTVRQYRRLLHAQFQQAVYDELIDRNPITGVQLHRIIPKTQQKKNEREPFTPEEMNIILTKIPAPWSELCALSFYTGGQRLGDICNLRWENIDMKNKRITFTTSKTAKKIPQPMSSSVYRILLNKTHESEYVFPEEHKRYTSSKGSMSVEFTAILRSLGILKSQTSASGRRFSVKSFHSIRHTVVSMLRSSGHISVDLCREIVGHDSEAIERAYYHASNDDRSRAIEYLEQKMAAQEPQHRH